MLEKLSTEKRNENTRNLDQMDIKNILLTMNHEDKHVPEAIEKELNQIEQAVTFVIQSLNNEGRLIYVGAGTSGRLGILDAVECTPTFGSPKELVQGFLAGGMKAFTEAVEGAEDSETLGKNDLQEIKLTERDTVVGVAASGRTPYVIGALAYANEIGAITVSITNNKNAEMSSFAHVPIEVETGPEVLTGSTRLKAGTAQKIVLNMISTASMVGIGKVYENLMVDVKPTNDKLKERSKRIIMEATGTDDATAKDCFEKSNHNVKTAIVMILLQCSYEEAIQKLYNADGFVRSAIEN